MKLLILALLLCFTIPLGTGCQTGIASATVAADKSVVASASAALNAWADHYVRTKKALTAAGETQTLAELEQERVLVTDAWKKYQSAASALVLAQSANYTNATNGLPAQIAGSISAAALPVIALINSILHK